MVGRTFLILILAASSVLAVLGPAVPGLPLSYACAWAPVTYWGNEVSQEPNTSRDCGDGLTWYSTDTHVTGHRVYLDAVLVQRPVGDIGTGSTGNPGVFYQVFALFGLWKDCNNDGYMGNQEARGSLGYRSVFLDEYGRSRCPDRSLHNDGEWVHELVSITPEVANLSDLYGLTNFEYRASGNLWADLGLPYDPYRPSAPGPLGDAGPKRRPDFTLAYHRGVSASALGVSVPVDFFDPARGVGASFCTPDGACSGWWSEPKLVLSPVVDARTRDVVTPIAVQFITTYALYDINAPILTQRPGGSSYSAPSSCLGENWDCYQEHWPFLSGKFQQSHVLGADVTHRDIDHVTWDRTGLSSS